MKAHTLPQPKAALALLFALALSACGGSEPGGGENTTTGSLLPLKVGNTWEYKVTDPDTGIVTQKRTTVDSLGTVQGTGKFATHSAFKVVTRKGVDLNDETVLDKTESWQGPDDAAAERIVRYRELSYGATSKALTLEEYWEPPRIHIDGSANHVLQGATWTEVYTEYKLPVGATAPPPASRADAWSVVNANESLDVLGKHFEHAVHFQKADKQYWYVRGIGKVKETGGQTEEIVTYNVGTVP